MTDQCVVSTWEPQRFELGYRSHIDMFRLERKAKHIEKLSSDQEDITWPNKKDAKRWKCKVICGQQVAFKISSKQQIQMI